MLNTQSPLVQRSLRPLAASCIELRALSDHCWADSDDCPSEGLSHEALTELHTLLNSALDQLKEIEAAYDQ